MVYFWNDQRIHLKYSYHSSGLAKYNPELLGENNYKQILINTKSPGFSTFSNDILHPNVNSIIPVKLKNLYINLLKTTSQTINNEFDAITYNQKFYSDYLHKNIIKTFFTDSESMCVSLLKSLTSSSSFSKFKNIVITNLLLIDISNKLTWNNLPKKLSYLNVFYKNDDIIYLFSYNCLSVRLFCAILSVGDFMTINLFPGKHSALLAS